MIGLIQSILLFSSPSASSQELSDRIRTSVQGAESYFMNEGLHTSGRDVIMILDVLKNKNEILDGFPAIEEFIANDPELRWSYFQVGGQYFQGKSRITIPDSLVLNWLSRDYPSMDVLTVYSFYCVQYGLPKDYLSMLYRKTVLGDYDLTHAALQLAACEQNGCISATDSVNQLRNLICEGLEQIIEMPFETEQAIDIYAETLVMKSMLKGCKAISSSEISRLLQVQNADGGWPSGRPGEDSRHHASMLGLWALVNYCAQTGIPLHQ
jgi:hypothetical protein